MFDIKKFLTDNWPTPAEMHAWLVSFGVEIGASTVYMWFYRETVPAMWLPRILAFLEVTRGAPVSLLPWLVPVKPKRRRAKA